MAIADKLNSYVFDTRTEAEAYAVEMREQGRTVEVRDDGFGCWGVFTTSDVDADADTELENGLSDEDAREFVQELVNALVGDGDDESAFADDAVPAGVLAGFLKDEPGPGDSAR